MPHVDSQVPPFSVLINLYLVDADLIFLRESCVNLIMNGERYTALLCLCFGLN